MAAFTTIATAASLAATAGSTAMSFTQANKQRKLQRQAELDAEKAMKQARERLDVNFYESLSLPLESYERQREALLSSGAQAIQAGREGEARGAAATAGRVQMAQLEEQGKIRDTMGKELLDLEKLKREEDARLKDIGVQLDLEDVAGAQLASANAESMYNNALSQGMQGVTSLVGQLSSMAPLYDKSKLRQNEALQGMFTAAENSGDMADKFSGLDYQNAVGQLGMVGGIDFSGVSKMTPEQFNSFMMTLDKKTLKDLNNRGFFGQIKSNPFLTQE
jgi:hypothetical protein